MIPLRLHVMGLGPHTDTLIDFSAHRSPIAIVAPSNTGKTILLEAMVFALYGQFVFYSAAGLYEMVTQGGIGDASVEFDFSHEGRRYRATRALKDTGKTQTHSAMLFDLDSPNPDMPIAGPNVKNFNEKIVSMLGDFRTFVATRYMGQKGVMDLCGNPGDSRADLVAKRRKVFDSISGLSGIEAISKRAGEEAIALEKVCRELEAQLAGEPDYGSAIAEARLALDGAEIERGEARLNLATHELALESARCRLRDAQGGDDALRAQVDAHERAGTALADARRRATTLEGEIAALEARAAGLGQAQADAQALREGLLAREALNGQATSFAMWEAWERARVETETEIRQTEQQIEGLASVPGVDAETRALAGRVEEIRDAGIAAKQRNAGIETANDAARRARTQIESEMQTAEGQRQGLVARQAQRPVTPFGEACSPCPLMVEWASIPAQLAAINERLINATARLASVPAEQPLADLGELRLEYQRAESARLAVTAAAGALARLEGLRAALGQAAGRLDAHRRERPMQVLSPAALLRDCQRRIDALAGAPERVRTCEQAAEDAGARRAALAEANTRVADAHADTARLAGPAEMARAALADRERQRAYALAEVSTGERAVREARLAIDTLTGAVARHGAIIESLEARRAAGEAKRARAVDMRGERDALADVRACFGPKGFKQIFYDSIAIPDLEGIADSIYQRGTNGRQRLRIATQRALGDGSIEEDFAILIRDSVGERDVLRYCGGEQETTKALFRFCVAAWDAKLHGTKIDCIVMDEPFTAFGEDDTVIGQFFEVLDFIGSQTEKIIIITHMQSLSDRLASKIRLVKGIMGVRVETGGR